jgi:four helix bundle protein
MATAKHHEDLDVWRLATEICDEVSRLVEREKVKRDRGFCDQILRSSRSAPANVAEGFARYRPREFARFLRIAIGSLAETQNHLREAQRRKYLEQEDFDKLWRLSRRALGAATKLHNYLKDCPNRR